jgi:hypothetical protein
LGVGDLCAASTLGLLEVTAKVRALDTDTSQLDASRPLLDSLLSSHRIVFPRPPSLTVMVTSLQSVGAHEAHCFLSWLLMKLENVGSGNRINRIVIRVDKVLGDVAELVICFNQRKGTTLELVLIGRTPSQEC